MFRWFRRKDPQEAYAKQLHDAIIERSRAPIFHTDFRVPDTIDGRFDLLTLHGFLVLEALREQGEAGEALGTRLATETFAGFEAALRDLGVSDMGLSRRIKAMANAFYGRVQAYSSALSEEAMAAALIRNLYRGDTIRFREATALAGYVQRAREALGSEEGSATLLSGTADFGALPRIPDA
jgi:cytochrome b pre-mRNA-processing protein 3